MNTNYKTGSGQSQSAQIDNPQCRAGLRRGQLVRRGHLLLLLGVLTLGGLVAHGATYRVGDTVTNFTLIARKQFTRPDGTVAGVGSPVRLSDFAGRIIFFEWFAVWCPYCIAAAPQVETGIVDWYAARHGNPSGVPVLHVAVNQEAASFYQNQTSNFVENVGFAIVLNDYDSVSTNRVRFSFQPNGQPIFVVINGVTNSPSHRPWELLINHQGYGDRDFNLELANFRSIIDRVQMPIVSPVLGGVRRMGTNFEFTVETQPGHVSRVQRSTDLANWTTVAMVPGTNAPIVFRDPIAQGQHRFYRAVTP